MLLNLLLRPFSSFGALRLWVGKCLSLFPLLEWELSSILLVLSSRHIHLHLLWMVNHLSPHHLRLRQWLPCFTSMSSSIRWDGVGTPLFFIRANVKLLLPGPLPWVYVADIFPTRTRHYGLAVASASQWLWSELKNKSQMFFPDDVFQILSFQRLPCR